mmetsp:Transcript_84016/g.145148  ORF Transcript_84016/g.145148 Transcript_84016/m.145148 type:complete len:262 (-) Transcript_84016:26-811(-)
MANATHEGPPGAERPGEAPVVQKAEVREFKFANDQEPYGFVNIGARVCHVIPGTLAGGLGVQPGWYIALIDGEKLYGATINLRRTIPAVTTEEVHDCLRSRRAAALRQDSPVRIIFWTAPMMVQRPEAAPKLEAGSVKELKQILVHKYGSVVAAWREAMDKDGSGTLDYKEFLAACREVGFSGSLKKVYSELDRDGSGQISLRELDPTCEMDFTIGLCACCRLPNPCERHTVEDQRRLTLKIRKKELEEDGVCNVFDVEVG